MRKGLLVFPILILLSIGLYTTPAFSEDVRMVTKEELNSLLGKPDVVIFDVRIGSDYFSNDLMIKGAVRPDMSAPIWHTSTRYPRENTFVLYCCSPHEEQSVLNAKLIMKGDKNLGHQPCANVYVLKGGWEEWLKGNYPTEKK